MVQPTFTREELLSGLSVAPDEQSAWSTLTGLLSDRYSCRRYRADPVPRTTLEDIFTSAQLSGSWCNAQPWQSIVTDGDATDKFRAALFDHACQHMAVSEPDYPFPTCYEGVYGERRREAGWALYDSLGIVKGDREASARQMMENYRLFDAPHVLILTTEDDLGLYGAVDCGIYLANLMLLMQSRGIASIAQGALAKFAPFVRDYFSIPTHRRVLCALSFGYADETHPANSFRTRRAAPVSAVEWVDD